MHCHFFSPRKVVQCKFGYGEVNQYNRSSTLMSAFKNLTDPKFRNVLIREKSEVYKALTTFFTAGDAVRAS
jgi:uncharacterized sporulation protein YeaH/YhbH (DUF444 family)